MAPGHLQTAFSLFSNGKIFFLPFRACRHCQPRSHPHKGPHNLGYHYFLEGKEGAVRFGQNYKLEHRSFAQETGSVQG